MAEEHSLTSHRKKLVSLLAWVAAHPDVADIDTAAEQALSAIEEMTSSADLPVADVRAIQTIGDVLNDLVDTVGSCETEERNLKRLLWSQAVSSAAAARRALKWVE